MGIFKEICETREVSGRLAYLSVKQRLEEAISRGWVERVPVMKPSRFSPDQEWFRNNETGAIYRLVPLFISGHETPCDTTSKSNLRLTWESRTSSHSGAR
jgi:hypothetical protein